VVFASQVLGVAAVLDGRNALQTQAYGAEVRGSLTRSEVIISDGRIGFPAVRKSDFLVTMTQEATKALLKDLKESGTLIVDSTNVASVPETEARVYRFPITETARRAFGRELQANMVMLGVLTQITGMVSRESIEKAIRESGAKKNAETNIEAFRKGLELQPS